MAVDLINGRTPEEIKAALKRCGRERCKSDKADDCPYYIDCLVGATRMKLMKNALALIEHLESEREAALAKVPRWISVEERLPEKEGDYIVLIALNQNKPWFVARVYYRKNVGFHWKTGRITHWMPLPSGPEEEG